MKVLDSAYNVAHKYGVSFYDFGPFLSYVDGKIGMAFSVKTKNGFLNRIFLSDNINDFEDFLKKYLKYSKGSDDALLDDYEVYYPKLLTKEDLQESVNQKKEEKELNIIKIEFIKTADYLNDTYKERIRTVEEWESLKLKAAEKLNDYKKLLYQFYKKPFEAEAINRDDFYAKYLNRIDDNKRAYSTVLNKVTKASTLNDAYQICESAKKMLKSYLADDEFFHKQYEVYLYKNKIVTLEKMADFIKNILDTSSDISNEKLKEELDIIKNSMPFNNSPSKYISESKKEYDDIFKKLEDVKYYNIYNYLMEKKFIVIQDTDQTDTFFKVKEAVTKTTNDNIILLFSSLRDIIIHFFFYNSYDQRNASVWNEIYNDFLVSYDMPENYLIRDKFFNEISVDSFDSFITSLKAISNKLRSNVTVLNKPIDIYSNDVDNNYIVGSENPNVYNSKLLYEIEVNKMIKAFYNKKKLSKDISNRFIINIEDNNEILLFPKTKAIKAKNVNVITDYEFVFDTMEIGKDKLKIVTGIKNERKVNIIKCNLNS